MFAGVEIHDFLGQNSKHEKGSQHPQKQQQRHTVSTKNKVPYVEQWPVLSDTL